MLCVFQKSENNSNEVAITYGIDSVERIQKGEGYIGVALGSEHGVAPISKITEYHILWKEMDMLTTVALFNEAVSSNNKVKDLKGLQKAADHFLKNCYVVGIDYDNR